ncbi:glypican-5-like [Callorhinchus milii]|uniref:glypican-5-like n=1 Tax=Callorhinchus milii TaxID=7868 RepID=UPI001C3F8DEA|nr:glypican-5-like [Callorhinchus milii]
MMEVKLPRLCCGCSALLWLLWMGLHVQAELDCQEVKKVFQLRQIGPSKWLPQTPRAGSDLQVCTSKNPTCCTKKMEDRYQTAARQEIQNLLQTLSSSLKFLISRNAAAFQDGETPPIEEYLHAYATIKFGSEHFTQGVTACQGLITNGKLLH